MKALTFLQKSLIALIIAIFSIGLSQSKAQIGPLGIYGSIPSSFRQGAVRYVQLDTYPIITIDESYVLPVNGLGNFNFYYKPDGTGFLPAGTYTVKYLNASRTTVYQTDVVTYAPNSGNTNGVEIRPFNLPTVHPLGIYGRVKVQIGSNIYPVPNATVVAEPHHQQFSFTVHSRTNADGYFSVYYLNTDTSTGIPAEFLPIDYLQPAPHEDYSFSIQAYFQGCFYVRDIEWQEVQWAPTNTLNPGLSSYFVTSAEQNLGDIVLDLAGCD